VRKKGKPSVGSTILYGQTSVHREIVRLFKAPTCRRVAVAAFVGRGAESYLPNPKGITLVCWPKAGGTNPQEVRKLIAKKVDVWFADKLHMKVYWAEGRGCVLTSANLSTNALGSGSLKELGILIDSAELDIDALLASLDRRTVKPAELKRLDRDHARFVALNQFRAGSSLPTFMQWLRLPIRPVWKLGWADLHKDSSKTAKKKTKEEYGIAEPSNFLGARLSDYREHGGEWILQFFLKSDAPTEVCWMFSDFVVKVPRKDKKSHNREYPCEVVQVWPTSRYPGCPFRIDKSFRRAFRAAMKTYSADKIRSASTMKPPHELVDLIVQELKAQEG
jgi:hypothetical protein